MLRGGRRGIRADDLKRAHRGGGAILSKGVGVVKVVGDGHEGEPRDHNRAWHMGLANGVGGTPVIRALERGAQVDSHEHPGECRGHHARNREPDAGGPLRPASDSDRDQQRYHDLDEVPGIDVIGSSVREEDGHPQGREPDARGDDRAAALNARRVTSQDDDRRPARKANGTVSVPKTAESALRSTGPVPTPSGFAQIQARM